MSAADMVDGQEDTDAAWRLILGSDAWQLVTEELRSRLVEVLPQRDNAATANIA